MGSFFCCSLSSKTQSCDSVINANGDHENIPEERAQLVPEEVSGNNNFAEEENHHNFGVASEPKIRAEHFPADPTNVYLSENGPDTEGANAIDISGNDKTDHDTNFLDQNCIDKNGIDENGIELSETDEIESDSGDSIEEDEDEKEESTNEPKKEVEPRADVKLSASEMAELQDIFRMFDKDNSGSIDVTELEAMVSSLGIAASKEDLNDMIAEADVDNSGTIEFEEFKVLIGPHFQKEKPPEDFVDAFKFFDKDGDGYISRSELRQIMSNVDNDLAEADIEDMIREADANGDGKIDFDEFTKMMQNQQ